jgi:hypothetical protein
MTSPLIFLLRDLTRGCVLTLGEISTRKFLTLGEISVIKDGWYLRQGNRGKANQTVKAIGVGKAHSQTIRQTGLAKLQAKR